MNREEANTILSEIETLDYGSDNSMIINFAFDIDSVYHGQKVSENNLKAFDKAKIELKELVR